MGLSELFLNTVLRTFFRITCRLDLADLGKIPRTGPGILIGNHTSMVEAPLLLVFTRPRRAVGLGKKELWDNPIMGFAMKAWGTIPLDRQGMDRHALDAALDVLRRGDFIGMAPEGTRSRSGGMRRARPGAVFLAFKGEAPIWPIAQWGCENMGRNLKRLRRTDIHIRVGEPFTVVLPEGRRLTNEERQAMTDEMMYRIASMLPEKYRGHYSDLSQATTEHLRFVQPPDPA